MLMLLLSAALAAPEMIPASALDLVGRTAPAFEAKLLEGGDFALEDARGKPVVLSFWASWWWTVSPRAPCLVRLAGTRDDIAIYAVNVDRDSNKATRWLQQVKVDLPVVWDPDSLILGQYDVLSMAHDVPLGQQRHREVPQDRLQQRHGLTELNAALAELTGK